MDFTYDPKGLGEWFKGPEWLGVLEDSLVNAEAIYSTIVAKRTGLLADSPISDVFIGGIKQDRFVGQMTVGADLDYGASHEYGADGHPAAHDLQVVLNTLGGFG